MIPSNHINIIGDSKLTSLDLISKQAQLECKLISWKCLTHVKRAAPNEVWYKISV